VARGLRQRDPPHDLAAAAVDERQLVRVPEPDRDEAGPSVGDDPLGLGAQLEDPPRGLGGQWRRLGRLGRRWELVRGAAAREQPEQREYQQRSGEAPRCAAGDDRAKVTRSRR